MKRLSLLAVVLLLGLQAVAQDMKKFYMQNLHPDGLLYFVLPQEMPEVKDARKVCLKPLSYDYTYLDARDSVTLLMTVTTNEVFGPDTLRLAGLSQEKAFPVEQIYCDLVKKGWECRVGCQLSYADWEEMYRNARPFVLSLSGNGICARFACKPDDWEKLRACFVRLQDVIRLNRK